MPQTLDISNYKFCQIKKSKFEILKVYTIKWKKYMHQKIKVCYKDSIPLVICFHLCVVGLGLVTIVILVNIKIVIRRDYKLSFAKNNWVYFLHFSCKPKRLVFYHYSGGFRPVNQSLAIRTIFGPDKLRDFWPISQTSFSQKRLLIRFLFKKFWNYFQRKPKTYVCHVSK